VVAWWRDWLVRRRLPTPRFFVSVASKGVTDADLVSVDSKGVVGGRFRSKHGKTRCSSVSVASKGVMGVIFGVSAAEKQKTPRACWGVRLSGPPDY
jgi:hypothetical protein